MTEDDGSGINPYSIISTARRAGSRLLAEPKRFAVCGDVAVERHGRRARGRSGQWQQKQEKNGAAVSHAETAGKGIGKVYDMSGKTYLKTEYSG